MPSILACRLWVTDQVNHHYCTVFRTPRKEISIAAKPIPGQDETKKET
jgi:hypothetical protein